MLVCLNVICNNQISVLIVDWWGTAIYDLCIMWSNPSDSSGSRCWL